MAVQGGIPTSPALDHLHGTLERLSSYRIQYQVHIMHHLLKWGRSIINHSFCAERTHEIPIGLRGRADHLCAFPPGKLNREGTNATSSPVDQDALTRLQCSIFKERCPGNRRSAGDRGCFVKTERLGLAGQ